MSESDERKAASQILENLLGTKREVTPANEDTEIFVPAISLLKLCLLRIEKQGGKVDASLVGMLSSAGMLQEMLSKQPGITKDERCTYEARCEVATAMADELVHRNLVELPVVTRGRGRG